jgi:hypothetical protein
MRLTVKQGEGFRRRVEAAHQAFHELVGPAEPPRFQHSSEEEFDPAAQLRRLAAARDEARAQLAAIVSKLPNPSTIKDVDVPEYQKGLIDAARIVRDCIID